MEEFDLEESLVGDAEESPQADESTELDEQSDPESDDLTFDENNAPLVIWNDENTTEVSDGWYESNWFGTFFGNTGGWTFHNLHGWLFLVSPNQEDLWIFDDNLGWLYTSEELYPFLYADSSSNWIYDQSNSHSRSFWDYSDSSYIHLDKN